MDSIRRCLVQLLQGKCYLDGCIEVMVFGEKFLLNVGAAKTADKAVVKGLREIFPG